MYVPPLAVVIVVMVLFGLAWMMLAYRLMLLAGRLSP